MIKKLAFIISVVNFLHKIFAIAVTRFCIFARGQGFAILNAKLISEFTVLEMNSD